MSAQTTLAPFSIVLSRTDEVHEFAAELRLDILSSMVAQNWAVKRPSIACFVKFKTTSKPSQPQPRWSNYLFSHDNGLDRRQHGLASMFDLREIPVAIKQDLATCFKTAAKGVSATDLLAQTECLVGRIFAFMAPYDDSRISIVNIPSSINVDAEGPIVMPSNIPQDALLVKFVREILCNPWCVLTTLHADYTPSLLAFGGMLLSILPDGDVDELRARTKRPDPMLRRFFYGCYRAAAINHPWFTDNAFWSDHCVRYTDTHGAINRSSPKSCMMLLQRADESTTMPDPLRFFDGKEHATVDDFLACVKVS
jgi:hypothetical protein